MDAMQVPTVTQLIMAWGPGLLFMLGAGFLIYKLGGRWLDAQGEQRKAHNELLKGFAERFLGAQEKQAEAVSELAQSHREVITEQRETTVAVQALALKFDELRDWLRMEHEHRAAHHAAAGRGDV